MLPSSSSASSSSTTSPTAAPSMTRSSIPLSKRISRCRRFSGRTTHTHALPHKHKLFWSSPDPWHVLPMPLSTIPNSLPPTMALNPSRRVWLTPFVLVVNGAKNPSDCGCIGFLWKSLWAEADIWLLEYLEELSEVQVLCSLPFTPFHPMSVYKMKDLGACLLLSDVDHRGRPGGGVLLLFVDVLLGL
ncbi:hypothetical protein Fmac_008171 [Flemingia macrophylla]|uniref:Uncharacterized protein n=1 Tax=Flemingia macrophylla TaxID=520843 RepID=A0ABD1MX60_9FABA